MKSIIIKSFVIPFYRAHLGLFMLLIIFFGVFMRPSDHVLLAQFIIQSPYGLTFVIFLFILYSLLHIRFNIQLLHQNNYLVFHQMALFPPVVFYKTQLYSWLANYQLILIYTAFLSIQSILLGLWAVIILLWLTMVALYIISTGFIFHQLKKTYPDPKARFAGTWVKSFQLHYHFWFPVHLIHKRPLLLLGAKSLSLLMLNLFFSSYYSGGYDLRWLQFGIICASFINYFHWEEKSNFENKQLSYFRNMPMSIGEKAFGHFLAFIQVLIPELLFLLYQLTTVSNTIGGFTLLLLLVALNAGLYGLIHSTKNKNNLTRNSFIAFFSLFFIVLFGIPAPLIILLCMITFVKIFYLKPRR
ncbi:hypothetical protein JKA74_19750 [Marivirga sp. S37H4]|uniref:Uncharacterized protein n=1 Tax=Marivirga aurantiaca TaxID=2802615 RepID=A0A934X2X6_9BACT|nr:hypothetical protein [Marivirga aurantiaca]MBK6267286.1 hypothetical protein [Marivirga aurantiaca]